MRRNSPPSTPAESTLDATQTVSIPQRHPSLDSYHIHHPASRDAQAIRRWRPRRKSLLVLQTRHIPPDRLLPGTGEPNVLLLSRRSSVNGCRLYKLFTAYYRGTHYSKGDKEKALEDDELRLRIASSYDLRVRAFWIHLSLAELFSKERRFDEANSHITWAKRQATNGVYNLASAMWLQARIWSDQDRFEEVEHDVSRAIDASERLVAVTELEGCREFLNELGVGKAPIKL